MKLLTDKSGEVVIAVAENMDETAHLKTFETLIPLGLHVETPDVATDEMVERACAVLEDAGYEDTGDMNREAVRQALEAALSTPSDA